MNIDIFFIIASGAFTLIVGMMSWMLRIILRRLEATDQEVEKLRKVRHDDRDKISEICAHIEILKHDFEDWEKDNNVRHDRMEFLFKQTARMVGRAKHDDE